MYRKLIVFRGIVLWMFSDGIFSFPVIKRIQFYFHLYCHQGAMKRPLTPQYNQKYTQLTTFTSPFAEDISKVIHSRHPEKGSIFISNIQAAKNPHTLRSHKIGAVLTSCKGHRLQHQQHIVPHYLYLPGIDHQSYNLSQHFEDAVDFITKHLEVTNVLVHCIAGVSRSSSLVIAYLIREHGMGYHQAYRKIRAERDIVHPNQGFQEQLKRYENQQRRVSRSGERSNSSARRQFVERVYATPTKNQEKKLSSTATYSLPKQNDTGTPTFKSRTTTYEQKSYQTPSTQTRYSQKSPSSHSPHRIYAKSTTKSPSNTIKEKPFQSLANSNIFNSAQRESYLRSDQKQYTPGYFQTLNSELQQKIEKIKRKYDIQRSQLHDRYNHNNNRLMENTKPTLTSPSEEQYVFNPQYVPKYAHLLRLKTDSGHTQAEPFIQRTRTDLNNSTRNTKIDDLFPKAFYVDKEGKQIYNPQRKSPKKGIITTNTLLQQRLTNSQYQQSPSHANYSRYEPQTTTYEKKMINPTMASMTIRNKHYH